jgi:hypothetical protein
MDLEASLSYSEEDIFDIRFPDGDLVSIHNAYIEAHWPEMYNEAILSVKEAQGDFIGGLHIDYKQFMALLKVGLMKFVYVETSDDERFLMGRYWNPVDGCYSNLEDFNDLDLWAFIKAAEYAWSVN